MTVYYNEIDPGAAAWLRELIKAGHIAAGEVDERSIEDVNPKDLAGFSQCHFFAGIGGWSHALRLAGWPDSRPVWTGSAPCQPFSAAGKGLGESDERHLWPAFYRLIAECRPGIIFGEQVASSSVVGRSKKTAGPGVRKGLPAQESRQGLDSAREVTCGEEGRPVRLGQACRGDSVADRRGGMRGDGYPVESGWRQNMGQPEFGQSEPICGLPLFKCAGGASCAEQCDGGLGGEHRHQDGRRDDEAAEGFLERILAAHRREPEGPDEWAWIDVVRADLERACYAFGASDIPAAGIGAPHIRQRLYWVANAEQHRGGCEATAADHVRTKTNGPTDRAGRRGSTPGGLADLHGSGRAPGGEGFAPVGHGPAARADRGVGGMADSAQRGRREEHSDAGGVTAGDRTQGVSAGSGASSGDQRTGALNGFWSAADWLGCRDGKWRPVEPGTFPLAHGLPARVGRLRGYGNAIVPQVAAAFVRACT